MTPFTGKLDQPAGLKPFDGTLDGEAPKSPLAFINAGITSLAGRLMGNSGTIPVPVDQIDAEGKRRAAADQAAQEQRISALRPELHAPEEGVIGRTAKNIAGGFIGALAQPAEYIGRRAGIKSLEDVGQSGQEYANALQEENPGLGGMLASGVGSLASFLVPGGAVGKVTKGLALAGRAGELAGAAKAGATAEQIGAAANATRTATRLGQYTGAGVASGAETLGNAQSTYEDALKNSGNPVYAEGQGTKDAIANLPLNFVADKLGFFGGAQHRAANAAYKAAIAGGADAAQAEAIAVQAAKSVAAPIIKDVGAGAASEFVQEGGQQVLQNVFGHNPVGDQVAENALVGGILGGAAGGIHGGIVKRGFNQASEAPTSDAGIAPVPPASGATDGQQPLQSDAVVPPAPIQRDEAGASVHPEDVATQAAAADPNAGPLTRAAAIAATPVSQGEPTATEQARLNATLSEVAGDQAAQQKAADVEQKRQQAALEEADARVQQQRQVESEAQRRSLLDAILENSDVQDPVGKLNADLKRAGYQGEFALPTKEELGRIKRFQDVRAAIDEEHVAAGTPNEMDVSALVPEKGARTPKKAAAAIKLPDDLILAANAAKALKDGPTAFFQAVKRYTKDEGQRKSLMAAFKAYVPPAATSRPSPAPAARPTAAATSAQFAPSTQTAPNPATAGSTPQPASTPSTPASGSSVTASQTGGTSPSTHPASVGRAQPSPSAATRTPVGTSPESAATPTLVAPQAAAPANPKAASQPSPTSTIAPPTRRETPSDSHATGVRVGAPDSVTRSSGDYYVDAGLREMAHGVRKGDPKAIADAAKRMAPLVDAGSVLVPMPSRTGQATHALTLAKAIAEQTKSSVADVLQGRARESVYDMKKSGKKPGADFFGMMLNGERPTGNVVLVDNVIDTGATLDAARRVLPNAHAVALAEVKTPKADPLHAAHEVLVKAKSQTNAMQRRVIDGAVDDARKIRAGDVQPTTAYAKTLRAKADTVNRWDPKAANAIRVLADHVDATRPRTKLEQAAIEREAHKAATSPRNDLPLPTEAQKEAGNYTKGHVRIASLDISIENPQGSQRRPEWPPIKSHYGYIKGTVGKDKDHIDVFVKPGTSENYVGPVFVVDQKNRAGGFDEHKVMVGWPNKMMATRGYSENYTKGFIVGPVSQASIGEFKAWLASGNTTKPFADRPVVPKETRTPGQANNASLKRELQRLGIDRSEQSDITGEKGRRTGAMPGTFRDNGMTIDDWAERLHEDGWLPAESQSERGNENIRASSDATREFIQKVLAGQEVHRIGDQQDEAGRLAHAAWLEHEAAALELPAETVDELVDSGLNRAQNEQDFDAARELAGLPDVAKETILERAAIQADNGADYNEAVRTLAAAERARLEGRESDRVAQGQADYALIGQTNAEAVAADKAKQDAKDKEQSETKAAEQKVTADAQRKDFALTGSDRQADNAQQNSLFAPAIGYTHDLFAQPLPVPPRADRPARAASNVHVGTAVPGDFATEVRSVKTGEIRLGVKTIASPQDAAHAFAALRKMPREYFAVIVTDQNDKPLSYLPLFSGAESQTSVYPGIVAKAVYQTPGAANIWIAHNHPSGEPRPSRADERLTQDLSESFGDSVGVRLRGHVIIAGQQSIAMDEEGNVTNGPFKIPAAARQYSVPMTEMRYVKTGRMGPAISSPKAATEAMPAYSKGKAGVLFLDAQNFPTAFYPMTITEMQRLRTRNALTGFGRLMQAAAKSGGTAAMINVPANIDSVAAVAGIENVGAALKNNGRDIRVLDAFYGDKSFAARGYTLAGNGPFASMGRLGATQRSALDSQLIAQLRTGGDAKSLLQAIVLKSDNALNKAVANLLLKSGIEPKVKLGRVDEFKAEQLPRGIPANALDAMYDPNLNTVTLFNPKSIEHDTLHELMHAATFRAIRAKGIAATQMQRLYDHVLKFETFDRDAYGLTSLDEFVAEAFSNRAFQQELKGIPAVHGMNVKTAWDWFTNVVRAILGLPSQAHNALSQTLEVGQLLVNEGRTAREQTGVPVGSRQDVVPAWLKAMPQATQDAAKKAGLWVEQKTIKERFDDARKDLSLRLVQGLVDQFAPLKVLDNHAYMLARLTKSGDAPLEGMMYYGKPFLDKDGAIDITAEKGGLIGVLQKLGGETDRFMAWIAGNRAAQLKAAGKENLFTDDDITALKDLNSGNMADGQARSALYAQVHREFNAYGKAVLDIADKAGIINGADRAVWEKDFYVPFYRVLEDDKVSGPRNAGGLTNQYAFKTLKGGTENLSDLFGNTLRNWSHLLNASLKNQAADVALSAAEKAGAAATTNQAEKGTVFVLRDGKKKHYAVSDPLILNAITALDTARLKGVGIDIASKFKHALTLGVTISPSFRLRNLIRDQLQAAGTTPVGMNIMSNLVSGWKGMDKESPEYARMVAGGAFMHFGLSLEADRGAFAKRLINQGVDASTILDNKTKIRAALEGAWHWWEDVGSKSENITRAAIYKNLTVQGKSHLEASFEARDAMDFSMQGAYPAMRLLTQVVPFLNARAQGLYKLGRDGISPTARVLYNSVTGDLISVTDRQKALRFSVVTGSVIMASLALMLAYRDDDDWKKREAFDRDNFWWFKVGSKAFRIPKPFEIGALASVTERGLEAMLGGFDKESRRIFLSSLQGIVMDNLAMNPTPQLIKPLVDLYANKDSFTGRPIETAGMEHLSKGERIGPNTSAAGQLLGKAEVLSPVQIDHLIQGYFGWLGSHAVMTADYALRPAMGLPGKPAMRIDDTFVLGDWVKQLPSDQSRYLTQFYDQAQSIQQAFADMRHYQQLGQTDKAAEILATEKDKIGLNGIYAHTQREIGKVNQRIRYTEMQSGDGDQKRVDLTRLFALRNRLAETAESARTAAQAGR